MCVHVVLLIFFIPLILFWVIKSMILNFIKQTKQWPSKCLNLRNWSYSPGMYTAHALSNDNSYIWYRVTMTFNKFYDGKNYVTYFIIFYIMSVQNYTETALYRDHSSQEIGLHYRVRSANRYFRAKPKVV